MFDARHGRPRNRPIGPVLAVGRLNDAVILRQIVGIFDRLGGTEQVDEAERNGGKRAAADNPARDELGPVSHPVH